MRNTIENIFWLESATVERGNTEHRLPVDKTKGVSQQVHRQQD